VQLLQVCEAPESKFEDLFIDLPCAGEDVRSQLAEVSASHCPREDRPALEDDQIVVDELRRRPSNERRA
jgi:hypothetical protein